MKTKPEFCELMPPLTEEEYAQLKKNIQEQGYRADEPVLLWHDFVIDGHNRVNICKELGLTPPTLDMSSKLATEDVVKLWIIDNQLGRRNLPAYAKVELSLFKEPIYAEQAKERQKGGQGGLLLQNSAKAIHKDEKLAKDAGVSRDTVQRVRYLKEHAPAEAKKQLRAGKLTINEVFNDIKVAERKLDLQKQREAIAKGELKLPEGVFEVLVVDPPWEYGVDYHPDVQRGTTPYPTMKQGELLDIKLPAAKDSVLWLWTTNQFIWDAKELMDSWGFEYKGLIVWDKEKMGIGRWFRLQCEYCLMGVKDKPKWDGGDVRDIIREARREHSRKPEAFYQMVEKVCVGRKLDYFSREQRKGWETFGNEVNKFKK